MEHPKYTLPGVMHYLQTEFTNMEKYKILNNLELSEMKFKIAKLEGDKASLLKINSSLNRRIGELETKCESLTMTNLKLSSEHTPEVTEEKPEDMDLHISYVDLDPIRKSRDSLARSMKEIVYLLKTPAIDNYDLLHLNKELDFFPVKEEGETEPSSFYQAQSHEIAGNAQNNAQTIRRDSSGDFLSEELRSLNREHPNPYDSSMEDIELSLNRDIDNLSLHRDIESDAETIVEDIPQPSVSAKSSPVKKKKPFEDIINGKAKAEDDNVSSSFQVQVKGEVAESSLYVDHNSHELVVARESGAVTTWDLQITQSCAHRGLELPTGTNRASSTVLSADGHFYVLTGDSELLVYAKNTSEPIARTKLDLPEDSYISDASVDHHTSSKKKYLIFVNHGSQILLNEVQVVGPGVDVSRAKTIDLEELSISEEATLNEKVLTAKMLPFLNQIIVATTHRYVKYDLDTRTMSHVVPSIYQVSSNTIPGETAMFLRAEILDNVLLVQTTKHELISYNLSTDTRIYSKTFAADFDADLMGLSLIGGDVGSENGERGPDDFVVILTLHGNVFRVLTSKFHLIHEFVYNGKTNQLSVPTRASGVVFKSRNGNKKVKGPMEKEFPMTFIRADGDLCALVMAGVGGKTVVNVFHI